MQIEQWALSVCLYSGLVDQNRRKLLIISYLAKLLDSTACHVRHGKAFTDFKVCSLPTSSWDPGYSCYGLFKMYKDIKMHNVYSSTLVNVYKSIVDSCRHSLPRLEPGQDVKSQNVTGTTTCYSIPEKKSSCTYMCY